MASKRKAAPVRSKVAKPKKKTSAVIKKASAPAARMKPAKAPVAKAPVAKAKAKVLVVKPVKGVVAKPAPGKAAPAGKGAAPMKGMKNIIRLRALPASERQAMARPIGALPPSAVARAIKPATLPVKRPIRPMPRPQRETTPDEGAQGVSQKDYAEFEQRLLEERKKLLKDMGHIESTVLKVNQRDSAGDLSGYSFHMADVGTDAMEREKAFLFASNEGHLLREIDDALRKIYGGEYGSCETCSRPIARARLEAVPYARLCKSCKEAEERSSRGQP